MVTAGLGVIALVAGTAGAVAALTSDESQVATVAGRAAPVVDLPAAELPLPPAGQTGLGTGSGTAPGTGLRVGPVTGLTGSAQAEKEADDTRSAPGEADRTATRSPRRQTPVIPGAGTGAGAVAPVRGGPAVPPPAGAPAGPVVRRVQITETEAVPFRTRQVKDSSLRSGVNQVRTAGAPGERRLRYEVTYTGNQETGRRLLDSTVTRAPRDRVVAIGTRTRTRTPDRPKSNGNHSGGNRGGGQHSNNDDDDDDDDRGWPRGGGWSGGGGWLSGGGGWPGGGWPGGGGWRSEACRERRSCVRMSRDNGCPESGRRASIVDGDLSKLDLADLEDLDLDLPCEDDE